MRHEPSRSRPPVQPVPVRRCRACRSVKPLDDFATQTGTQAERCASCRRRRAAVARRRTERALRELQRRADAGYCALLARHLRRRAGDAA